VSYAPQSSPGLRLLPACALLAALAAGPVAAQGERRLSDSTDLHRDPEGTPLVSLPAGAPVETGAAKGEWREAAVEGWIFSPSTAPTRRDGFDLVVTSDEGENLRRHPNGPVVGRVREGTLLEQVGKQGKWFQVRREGWVPRAAVVQQKSPGQTTHAQGAATPQTPASARPTAAAQTGGKSRAGAPAAAAPSAPAGPVEGVEVSRETGLARAPDSTPYATLQPGIPARVVARSGEWVRVQLDGWIREADLKPADNGVLRQVSAEEVQSSPARYVGQPLEWRLQLIAVQTADELRPEIASGRPYLLTRGPLPEPGFVYVTVPDTMVARFRALPPLQELTLRVSLTAARTRYLATPVADLLSVESGMDAQ
jgi:SH3 domain-containing protein